MLTGRPQPRRGFFESRNRLVPKVAEYSNLGLKEATPFRVEHRNQRLKDRYVRLCDLFTLDCLPAVFTVELRERSLQLIKLLSRFAMLTLGSQSLVV